MKGREFNFPAVEVVGATGGHITQAMLSSGITIRIPKFNNNHLYRGGVVVVLQDNNASAVSLFTGWQADKDTDRFIAASELKGFLIGHSVTVYGSLFEADGRAIGVESTRYTIVA